MPGTSNPRPSTRPVPITVTDDDLAAAMADTQPQPRTGPIDVQTDGTPATYQPDYTRLSHAKGDAAVWAHEFYEMIGHTTGEWVSEDTIEGWLRTLAQQVEIRTYRAAMFQVANTSLPAETEGDAALLLLQLRNDLASSLRHNAAVAS